ncbi:MAG: CopG family transcriptional regulator [Candidatus Dormibacteria bacterium]
MKKTSLYLNDGDVERVRRLAHLEGRSQAEVVRAALAAYESKLSMERRFALTGCADGDGRSVANIPEDELLQGFGS